jgi:hypothetical protein
MALQDVNSGTMSTSNQYIKYYIEMIENSTDVNSNLSNVTINVWVYRTNTGYTTYGTGTLYCTIAGTQYTAAIDPSQKITSSKICLFSKNLNIGHNGDGTGRVDTSAHISMDVVTSSDQGWGFGLTTIPRASIPTLSVTTFDMGTTITINTNRKSTDFTHTIVYTFGNDQANIAFNVTDNCTWAVPLTLANQIPSAASGWGTITCHTYNSSGTLIGSQGVNFTANCPASMVPTASGLTVAIAGTGRDKTLNKYVQTISKITASFTSAGVYSSTISSNTITVKRQSDNADSQTISSNSGTIANPVALSGTYIITATATDSRGRTVTLTTTVTVNAYSPPTVTTFSTKRDTVTTNVLATINASWSMGTDNPTNISVVGVNNVGTSQTLYTLNGSTAGSINTTQTYASQSDASAYTYTMTITDSFGNVAKATATVGTTFVEMSISQGHGVGVGKVWENGALDVGGLANFNGPLKNKLANNKVYRDLVDYAASSGSTTGTIKITLPKSWSSTMMNIIIRGYDYSSIGGGWELKIGGYNYITTSSWKNFNAQLRGGAPFNQVRLAHDGTNCCILLGKTTTVWAYERLMLTEMVAMYSNQDGWDSGWTVSLITDETGITVSGTIANAYKGDAILMLNGGGQSLSPSTWSRATWNSPDTNDGNYIWQPGGNANMFGVTYEGWYEVYYHVQINQSVNTAYWAQLWGNAATANIISPLYCNNNGWNSLSDSMLVYLTPNTNYELVLKQEDTGYTRSVDKHRLIVKKAS